MILCKNWVRTVLTAGWLAIFSINAFAAPSYCPSNPDNPTLFTWNGTLPSGWSLSPLSTILPQHDAPTTFIQSVPAETYTFFFASLNPLAYQISCYYVHLNNKNGFTGATAILQLVKNGIGPENIFVSPIGSFQNWFISPYFSAGENKHPIVQCGNTTLPGTKVTDCALQM